MIIHEFNSIIKPGLKSRLAVKVQYHLSRAFSRMLHPEVNMVNMLEH